MSQFWVDGQSVHLETECHSSKMSQQTVCRVDKQCGSKCHMVGLWVDGSSMHRFFTSLCDLHTVYMGLTLRFIKFILKKKKVLQLFLRRHCVDLCVQVYIELTRRGLLKAIQTGLNRNTTEEVEKLWCLLLFYSKFANIEVAEHNKAFIDFVRNKNNKNIQLRLGHFAMMVLQCFGSHDCVPQTLLLYSMINIHQPGCSHLLLPPQMPRPLAI